MRSTHAKLFTLNMALVLLLTLLSPGLHGLAATAPLVLTLRGNGGTVADGIATYTSLRAYYPAEHDLTPHRFVREDYVHVSWLTPEGLRMSLNDSYTPTSHTLLYALWAPVDPGDVVLHGLSGVFSDYSDYQIHPSTAALPKALTYSPADSLLGWTEDIAFTIDPVTHRAEGPWYSGGTTVSSAEDEVRQLYAQRVEGGQYAVYHFSDQALPGGNMLVQGAKASTGTLTVTVPGGDSVPSPEHHTLLGWSTVANAAEPQYRPGDSLTLRAGTVLHLYPCWQLSGYSETREGITAWIGDDSTVTITVPAALWAGQELAGCAAALYDGSEKLLDAAFQVAVSGEDVVLKLSHDGCASLCRVFLLRSGFAPGAPPVDFPLTQAILMTVI